MPSAAIDAIAGVRARPNSTPPRGATSAAPHSSPGRAATSFTVRVRVRSTREVRLAPLLRPRQAKTRQNHLGAVLAAIKSNRTFFFVDYDGYRLTQGVPFLVTVPTAKMRSGDFSELSGQIYDAMNAVRTPFPGNVIPTSRFDPIAVKYMQLYPLPNGPGLANNFSHTNERKQDNDATDVRIDHRFNDGNTVFGRYSYNKTYTLTPSLCPPTTVGSNSVDPTCIVGGAATGNYAGPNYTTAHNIVGSWVRVLNATTHGGQGHYSNADILSTCRRHSSTAELVGVPNPTLCSQRRRLAPDGDAPTTIAALVETQWGPLQNLHRTSSSPALHPLRRGAAQLEGSWGLLMRAWRPPSTSARGSGVSSSAATASARVGGYASSVVPVGVSD